MKISTMDMPSLSQPVVGNVYSCNGGNLRNPPKIKVNQGDAE